MIRPFKTLRRHLTGAKNTSDTGLIYAVGDIHGCYDLMRKLISEIIAQIEAFKKDGRLKGGATLIFLGDYIDRGLKSKEVVEYLRSFSHPDITPIFLKGNHEQSVLQFLENAKIGPAWEQYGAVETLASYGIRVTMNTPKKTDWEVVRQQFAVALPQTHLDFFKSLTLYHIADPYMFVHAGVDPKKPLSQQSEDEFLWIRNRFLDYPKAFPYIIVHGHTPVSQPVHTAYRIGLDTGAYVSGKLTAARLWNGKVDLIST